MTETSRSSERSSEALHREWLDHPRFRYRGCAPDVDDPQRMAGDTSLHVGAHDEPDAFSPEGQRARRVREDAVIEVCLNCPVMVACDAYASSVTSEGRLAQPRGVWGGRRALERHKALIARRAAAVAAPASRFETAQKRAIVRALAGCWDPFEVAEAASRLLEAWGEAAVDVRTANWQRSSLVRLLGLPKDATRMQALEAARGRGLLDGVVVVADDGSVPAVPPPTAMPAPVHPEAGPGGRVKPVQLQLWSAEDVQDEQDPGEGLADVHHLPVAGRLGAVA